MGCGSSKAVVTSNSVATEPGKSAFNGVYPPVTNFPQKGKNYKLQDEEAPLQDDKPPLQDGKAPCADFARNSAGAWGAETTEEEKKLFAVKTNLIKSWAPEYMPEDVRPLFFSPDVQSERATNVTLDQILQKQEHMSRKTKIVCTAGPHCWSAEMLSKLLDAGLNVLRFNFSHGDHQGHFEVLERFRQVCLEKGSKAAALLDTKGPEIRTAMLRDHKPISLEAGQSIIVEAVGAQYMEFKGYKDEGGETRIGLSYDKLCQSVKPGNLILLADGSISIRVEEISSDRELLGTVLNSKSLGERKNCNLPGVKVEIPVLTEKDINDLQNFAAKHEVDFVAASFVQSKADVEFIRRVLDEAGGQKTKIICKIENLAGVHNFDEILQVTDGVMVARGDLGMEIPSEKVPVAQKLMITKCNCAGKFVICATQMLESMISNPRPTRAEMTDVANAVYDGVDCVMLSGETANGEFADTAVATMAAIVSTAEIGVDYYSQLSFIRYWATKYSPSAMSSSECILSSTASMAVGFHEDDTPELLRLKRAKQNRSLLIVCLTNTGEAAAKIAKYRPPCPVVVVSTEESVLRGCSVSFGLIALKLLDAGMDIARFNFSHGDHAGQLEVLERLRKVWGQKEASAKSTKDIVGPRWACLLDTKGPEIRTAMLRDHKPISLEAGQSIVVEAVGAKYMEFEGYKDEGRETRIGLSYDKLCQSVKPGNLILLSDGSISVRVDEITTDRELRGTVLNSKVLGERKNCNLPGVRVEIPVLTDKDINDLQNFAAKHKMDFVAASFVQSAADVQYIRSVLNGAKGGECVKIISKIENAEGLRRYDEILEASDGIMVARGDMGMEIPPEKVPLAQKMLITKANIAGKFIVTATQMLESMIGSPRPTRAEMTDVANAVLDGTDAVMLSGETANGQFPELVVSTMGALCQNAEEMVDADKLYNFLRNHTPKPMMGVEAICSGAVQTAMDSKAKAILCITTSGRAPAMVSKFRPPMPVLVVTTEPQLVQQCRSMFGQVGILLKPSTSTSSEEDVHNLIEDVRAYCKAMDIVDVRDGDSLVVLNRRSVARDQALPYDDQRLVMKAMVLGESGNPERISTPRQTLSEGAQRTIIYHRSTKLSMDTIIDDNKYKYFTRKTKIVCTAGPACWDEANLGSLLDAGMSVLRFNFSHGDHAGHLQVLERFRKVCAAKGSTAATLLDTKGPEIRTAMLWDHKPISLEAGQSIIVEAVGAQYMEFEGYKDEGGETRIGLSYDKLCQSVKPGNLILLADGSISIRVDEILSEKELRGTVLNSKSLGERKNCNLPGVRVEIPVLTEKDINDLQNFAAKHKMDFVAASFVQTKEDVMFIRSVLDKAGGQSIKIISKIENCEGVENFDDILEYSDGVMVARGDLGMEISVEKVPLAQKVMITKANIAGKFAITATQMLESMITSPIPTRAEMTDVANAVVDGTDAVMLSGESANGKYPDLAVATMARICRSAEIGVNVYQTFDFIRTFTPKPVPPVEAVCAALAKNAVDIFPGMIIIFSETGKTPRLLAKYRPPAPVLVVTSNEYLARHCSSLYAMHAMMLPGAPQQFDVVMT
ncbi:pyruvate kinase [Dunaliella salina]|uniref:Pyruvate kinase n=1 Tax=Dunaliella salina TaxID=3046 RepID=A0ABQ7H825_DUNSA|nr:pyruvate kinase [Dunaliella salina]|eukprot:KAF5842973.1 pyruvate kinase [Dunaliella salina]